MCLYLSPKDVDTLRCLLLAETVLRMVENNVSTPQEKWQWTDATDLYWKLNLGPSRPETTPLVWLLET